MRNLTLPDDDPLAIYDTIVAGKRDDRGTRLRELRARIECAYLRYHCHQPALERQRPLGRRLTEAEAADLQSSYVVSRRPRSAVFDRVYAKLLSLTFLCAYCGLTQAETLDHYLPKDGKGGFPELSMLPANLIPSCRACNTPRAMRDAEGKRALIHPYFDAVKQDRLLFASVRIVNGLPDAEFRVDLSQCSDLGFAHLYARHVRLLDLLSRYRASVTSTDGELATIERTIRIWGRSSTRDEILEMLLQDAGEQEQRLGANHFKVALYRGAAASPAFIDHCRGGLS